MSTGFVRTGVVEYGRRKGSKQVGSWEIEKPEADLRQKVVLSKSEWQRVRDSVNGVDQQSRSVIAAAEQREALHARSREAVAHWPNTIAAQQRQKLEAKAVREAMAEEKRKRLDLEEAEHQAQRREDIIQRAVIQQFYQTDRVKGFHSALMLAEVQKEREAQLELKRLKLNARRDADREFLAQRARREEQAVQRDQQNALRRRRDHLAVSQSWTLQCQDHEMKKEQKRQEIRREAEELERLRDLDLRELAMKERKKQEEKRRSTKAFRELLTEREQKKAAEARRQEEEEEKRKQISSQREEQKRVWEEKQEGILRERQRPRDTVMQKLAELKQEDVSNEEESIAKAVAEHEAKLARVQREKEERRAAVLESVAAHREAKRRELQRKAEEEKQNSLETLNALKEADQLFREKQQLKAQKAKEERTTLQDIYIQQMAEKRARALRTRKEQKDFVAKNIAFFVEEENLFQKYAKRVIEAAEKAGRDVCPLLKDQRSVRGHGESAQVFLS